MAHRICSKFPGPLVATILAAGHKDYRELFFPGSVQLGSRV